MKTHTVRILGATLMALAWPMTGQVLLHSNHTPLPGLATGATSESGVPAPAGTQWSECQHPTGDLTQANTNAGFAVTQGTFRLADDFTVPAPGWNLAYIEVYGYRTGAPATPSPFTAASLQIWGPCTPGTTPGDAGCTTIAFGDPTTNRLATSTDVSLFRIFSTVAPPPGTVPGTTRKLWRNRLTTAVSLTPGLYWIDWATTAGGAHFTPSITVLGTRGLAGWNARQQTVAGGTWVLAVDPGNPTTAPDVPQDFPFEIYGTLAPVELQRFQVE